MIQMRHLEKELSFSRFSLDIYPVGEDIAAVLSGGERPHIGCAVLALPRPSLTGSGAVSCTSSVLNAAGHKDEAVCRQTAEALCRRYNAAVTCTGGFHQDNITPEQIEELKKALEELLYETEGGKYFA